MTTSRSRRDVRRASLVGGALLLAATALADGPAQTPEVHITLIYETPGSRLCHVNSWVQFVKQDSIDLVRSRPQIASLPRLEVDASGEHLVLQPRGTDPEIYRCPVPQRAALLWSYDLQLANADSLPFAI